jgi:hypothetical protein
MPPQRRHAHRQTEGMSLLPHLPITCLLCFTFRRLHSKRCSPLLGQRTILEAPNLSPNLSGSHMQSTLMLQSISVAEREKRKRTKRRTRVLAHDNDVGETNDEVQIRATVPLQRPGVQRDPSAEFKDGEDSRPQRRPHDPILDVSKPKPSTLDRPRSSSPLFEESQSQSRKDPRSSSRIGKFHGYR